MRKKRAGGGRIGGVGGSLRSLCERVCLFFSSCSLNVSVWLVLLLSHSVGRVLECKIFRKKICTGNQMQPAKSRSVASFMNWRPARLNSCPSAIVCTGGRSAVGGHALLRRAPGPEAPSAAQREGQRSALAAPVAAARQARSPALHGRRRHRGHRARLPGLTAHRWVSSHVFRWGLFF